MQAFHKGYLLFAAPQKNHVLKRIIFLSDGTDIIEIRFFSGSYDIESVFEPIQFDKIEVNVCCSQ